MRRSTPMDALDFSRSFMTWWAPPNLNDKRLPGHMPWGNGARIAFDARCEVIDDATGKRDEFVLIAPCRTEWMYRDEQIFQQPGGEYCVIFSPTRHRGVGT